MSKTNRFDGIVEFVETTRQGSFTAAAASLGLSKSAVGKGIARLESRLGARLFHRSTRRLSLTSDGQSFLSVCQGLMSELDNVESQIGVHNLVPAGQLRIDLPSAFGRLHVMPTLLELMGRYPELTISASFTDQRIDVIEEGVDITVRVGPPPDTTELIARQIGMQRLVICATPKYLSQHPAPHCKEDLSNHHCIVGRRNQARSSWLFREEGVDFRFPVKGHYEFGDGEAMLSAALAGVGLAQLPTWLAGEHLRSGTLSPVLKHVQGDPVPIVAIWPAARHVPLRVRVVVDALMHIGLTW